MKSYVKGVITGFLVGALIFAVPAIAENIDALFNQVRINVNGVDQIQWGEDIDLGDGESAPSSILYNGTTYLPMRKLGELSGQEICWNGDSKTVSMTGQQKDINVVAEKPDSYGNVWKYYTFKDDNGYSYLGVKDEARGYERLYRLSSTNMNVTENEIYFVRYDGPSPYPNRYSAKVIKISFDNNVDTQDGEEIKSITYFGGAAFYGDYVFFAENIPGNAPQNLLNAYNYKTGETAQYKNNLQVTMHGVSITQINENELRVRFGQTYTPQLIDLGTNSLIFDMSTNTFTKEMEKEGI